MLAPDTVWYDPLQHLFCYVLHSSLHTYSSPCVRQFRNWFETGNDDSVIAVALDHAADSDSPQLVSSLYYCDFCPGTTTICSAGSASGASPDCAKLVPRAGDREYGVSSSSSGLSFTSIQLAAAQTIRFYAKSEPSGDSEASCSTVENCTVIMLETASICPGGPRLSVSAGSYGGAPAAAAAFQQGVNWHAFDLLAYAAEGDGFEISIAVVDAVAPDNPVSGPAQLHYPAVRRLFRISGATDSEGAGYCRALFARLSVSVRDAATGQPVRNATATFGGARYPVPEQNLDGSIDQGSGFEGVGDIAQGQQNITVSAPGYASYTAAIAVAGHVASLDVALVPLAGGLSWVVLRWGNATRDLDLYVLPVGTRRGGSEPEWVAGADGAEFWPRTDQSGQPPYLWWGLGAEGGCGCRNATSFPTRTRSPRPCESACGLFARDAPLSRLDLYRDVQDHGTVVQAGGPPSANLPEVVSFASLPAGHYAVYAATAAFSEAVGDCDLDVWLGDSSGDVRLVSTVAVRSAAAAWVYLGLLQVWQGRTGGACAGLPLARPQVGAGAACYRWQGAGLPVGYPLNFPFRAYAVGLRWPSAAAVACTNVSDLVYRLRASSGSCGCDNCDGAWQLQGSPLGPFLPGVLGWDCVPDTEDFSYLDVWLGFEQTGAAGSVGYTLAISGPGILETPLTLDFAAAKDEGTCSSTLANAPPAVELALVMPAKLQLVVRHSQVKFDEYMSAANVKAMSDLRAVTMRVYRGGGCSCWDESRQLQVAGPCAFNGSRLGAVDVPLGSAGWTVTADAGLATLNLTALAGRGNARLCQGVYWVHFLSGSFYPRVVRAVLVGGSGGQDGPARLVLVATCSLCMRVVLEWGAPGEGPTDLDLHALNVTPPLAAPPVRRWPPEECEDPYEVYWVPVNVGPKFGGVTLDVDCVNGYGPETLSFPAGVTVGAYQVAVNIYTTGDESDLTTFASDARGVIVVSVYNGSGLVARETPPPAVRPFKAWWVGTVTRSRAGYGYASVGAGTAKFDRCQSDRSVDCTATCPSL